MLISCAESSLIQEFGRTKSSNTKRSQADSNRNLVLYYPSSNNSNLQADQTPASPPKTLGRYRFEGFGEFALTWKDTERKRNCNTGMDLSLGILPGKCELTEPFKPVPTKGLRAQA
jgi:hypothetical protein